MNWRTIPTLLVTPFLVLACAPEDEAPGPDEAPRAPGAEAPGEAVTEPGQLRRWSEAISEENPYEILPAIDAWYEGEKAWFIHTDVSDREMAERLTGMVGYGTIHAPRLGRIDREKVGKIYVFTNGVDRGEAEPWGGGPFHYQIDILDSVPGDSAYSALRNPHLVTWKETAEPRVLRSVAEVEEAERNGELTVERTPVIVNAPVVKWPTDYLGGEARLGPEERGGILDTGVVDRRGDG